MRFTNRAALCLPFAPFFILARLSIPLFLFSLFLFHRSLSLSVHLRFHRVWQLTASHLPLSLSPVPYRVSRRPPPKAHLPRAGSHCISNLPGPAAALIVRYCWSGDFQRSEGEDAPSQLTEHRGAPLHRALTLAQHPFGIGSKSSLFGLCASGAAVACH